MPDTTATATLTLEGARRVLDAALAKAAEMGTRLCRAVTDTAGEPIVPARMDGAPRLSAGIAANKAYSVAGFGGMPTAAWWGVIKDQPALVHGLTLTPRLTITNRIALPASRLVLHGKEAGTLEQWELQPQHELQHPIRYSAWPGRGGEQ